jgi:hypothetical protein
LIEVTESVRMKTLLTFTGFQDPFAKGPLAANEQVGPILTLLSARSFAYSVARWLPESAARGVLERYFDPPLTVNERALAAREGWILGVT